MLEAASLPCRGPLPCLAGDCLPTLKEAASLPFSRLPPYLAAGCLPSCSSKQPYLAAGCLPTLWENASKLRRMLSPYPEGCCQPSLQEASLPTWGLPPFTAEGFLPFLPEDTRLPAGVRRPVNSFLVKPVGVLLWRDSSLTRGGMITYIISQSMIKSINQSILTLMSQ